MPNIDVLRAELDGLQPIVSSRFNSAHQRLQSLANISPLCERARTICRDMENRKFGVRICSMIDSNCGCNSDDCQPAPLSRKTELTRSMIMGFAIMRQLILASLGSFNHNNPFWAVEDSRSTVTS